MQDFIEKAAAGDERAFEVLVKATEKMVYHICYRMTRDEDEALDLAQETYLKAWHALPLYKGESKFTTWLARIASNTCLDHIRKQHRKKQILTMSVEEMPLGADLADPSADPAVVTEEKLSHDLVYAALLDLPEEERLLLSLRALEELSYEEISEITELKVGTIKSKIFRAREKLRRNLSQILSSDNMKGGSR